MFLIIKSNKYLRNYFYVFLLLLNSVSRNSGSVLKFAGKSHLDNSKKDYVTFPMQQNLNNGYLRAVENHSVNNIALRNGIDNVPSCEKLRSMWIFSRRRARGIEITNEISAFHDSLNYNMPALNYNLPLQRFPNLYGILEHRNIGSREPIAKNAFLSSLHGHRNLPSESRYMQFPQNKLDDIKSKFNDLAKFPLSNYITEIPAKTNPIINPTRRFMTTKATNSSFQKLKDLIWTERVKDQKRENHAEEAFAKAFVLRNIMNGYK